MELAGNFFKTCFHDRKTHLSKRKFIYSTYSANSWIHIPPCPTLRKRDPSGSSWAIDCTAVQTPPCLCRCTLTRLSFKQHGIQNNSAEKGTGYLQGAIKQTRCYGKEQVLPSLPFLSPCSLLNCEQTLNGINLVRLQNG